MVNTTLRAYLDELNLLLEQEALEEVIGHCRHILQHFPRNVETYRLLGRALLEKRRHAEAADVFQRVLSAIPDDFVSHLGLSAVSEELGQLPAAVWHLESAFEQEPNNMALQGELQRLYEQRDGSMPTRIQMTHGALVRIYSKGRLFDQAIHELQLALAQAPDRLDLSLLLADVLWNMDRPLEAGEVALRILEKLPDSIDANRLIASLWLRSGRPSEATAFIARLEQLDPFLAWRTVQADGKSLPPNAFQLPRLDWDAKAAAALATDVPDWVNAISNVFEAPESVSLGGANNWLEEAVPAPEAQRGPLSAFDVLSLNRTAPTAAPDEAPVVMPDWMQDIATPASAPAEPATPALDPDVPDWFRDSGAATTAPAESIPEGTSGLPDWFEEAVSSPEESAPIDEPTRSDQLPSGFTDLLTGISAKRNDPRAEPPPAVVADLPDWMSDIEQPAEGPPAVEAASLDEMSWLSTGPLPSLDEAPPAAETPATEAEPLDAMSWLMTGPLPPLDEPAQAPVPQTDNFEEVPWQVTASLPPVEQATTETEPAIGGDLDWLSSMPAVETPAAEPAEAEAFGGDMDWLSSMPAVETPAEPAEPEPAIGGDLDWLSSMPAIETPAEPAEPEPAIGGDLDWLSSMPAIETPAEPAEPEPAIGGDLDWLSSMPAIETPAEPAEPVAAADNGLDWLGSVPTVETPASGAPATADSGMDWFGSLSSDESTSASGEPVAAADSGLDWLNRAPGMPEAADQAVSQVEDMFDLGSTESGTLDWMSAGESAVEEEPQIVNDGDPLAWMSARENPVEEEAQIVNEGDPLAWMSAGENALEEEAPIINEGDPMAWLRPYQDSDGVQDSVVNPVGEDSLQSVVADEAEEELAQAETPPWLSAMAPGQALGQPFAEPEPLDALDFGGLESEPTARTNDWLGSMDSTPEPAGLDWLSQPSTQATPAEEPALELEEDWLASFEAPIAADAHSAAPAEAVQAEPDNWQSSFALEPADADAEPASDWFSTLAVDQPVSTESAAPVADDWLGSLSVDAPASQSEPEFEALPTAIPEPVASNDDWFSALGDSEAEAAFLVPEEPASAPEPEAKAPGTGRLDSLVKQAIERPNPSRNIGDTGVLDTSAVPDWLSAVGEDSPSAESAAEEFSFDSMATSPGSLGDTDLFDEAMPADSPVPGETPSWLSEVAPASQSAAVMPVDDLDFGSLELEESGEVESAEVPAWMADIAPASASAAKPIDDLDFGSLELAGAGDSEAAQPDEFDFGDMFSEQAQEPVQEESPVASGRGNYDPFAQPANLVNTSGSTGAQKTPSFKFDRPPAWMRNRKAGGKPAAHGSAEDVPDWLKGNSDSSGGQQNDLPDWLK